MAFKSLHSQVPRCVTDLLKLKISKYPFHFASGITLHDRQFKLQCYGKSALSASTPQSTNNLAFNVKTSPTVDNVAKILKMYSFY